MEQELEQEREQEQEQELEQERELEQELEQARMTNEKLRLRFEKLRDVEFPIFKNDHANAIADFDYTRREKRCGADWAYSELAPLICELRDALEHYRHGAPKIGFDRGEVAGVALTKLEKWRENEKA